MIPSKPIIFFLVKALTFYVLLLFLWPAVKSAYVNLFTSTGNRIFHSFGSNGIVIFEPLESKSHFTHELRLFFLNSEIIENARKAASSGATDAAIEADKVDMISRTVGYLPWILFTALVMATPVSVPQRLFTLALGTLVIGLFVVFKMYLFILYKFNEFDHLSVALIENVFCQKILVYFNYVLFLNIGITLIVPVFIWMLFMLNRKNWKTLVELSTVKGAEVHQN